MVFDVEYVNAHLADMDLKASEGWKAGNFTDHMVFPPDTPAVIYRNEGVLPHAVAEKLERLLSNWRQRGWTRPQSSPCCECSLKLKPMRWEPKSTRDDQNPTPA